MTRLHWPALVLWAGIALVVLSAAAALALVPQALQTPGAGLLPVAVVALVAGYVAVGAAALRRPAAGDALGATVGIVAGGVWCVEIFAGGPALLSHTAEVAVGAPAVALATVATVSAGPLAIIRRPALRAVWRSGLYAGLVSGVIVFVFAVVMTLATLDILGSRSDYRAQFAQSGAPSMHAFLVQDILTATCSHLVINALLGVVGAALATAGLLLARSAGRSARARL